MTPHNFLSGRLSWTARVQKLGRSRRQLSRAGDGAPPGPGTSPDDNQPAVTLGQWATAYLEHAEKYARKTRNEKQQAFRGLFAAPDTHAMPLVDPDMPAHSLTPRQVLAALRVQFIKRGGNAANKDRKNLVAAWNWGITYLDLPERNPCKVEKFPEQRKPRYIPPEENFWKVYEAAAGQDRLMLLACLHLAARRSELFRLLWEDVDFSTRRIRLATRKRQGGSLEYDWLPMTSQLCSALLAWRDRRTLRDHDHVFACGNDPLSPRHPYYGKPYKERMQFMKRLCAAAGVKPFGFHAIRHLTASILYGLGQPVSVIQAILRHKSPATTTIYLRSLGLEETRNALESMARLNGEEQDIF